MKEAPASGTTVKYRVYDPAEDKEWGLNKFVDTILLCNVLAVRNARTVRDDDDSDDLIIIRRHKTIDDILLFLTAVNDEEIMICALKGVTFKEYLDAMDKNGAPRHTQTVH